MSFQAAPAVNANTGNQNYAAQVTLRNVLPPVFLRTFQAAPLPTAVNNQTIGHAIG